MNRICAMIAGLIVIALPSIGQSPGDANEGSTVTHDGVNNVFTLSWWGRTGQSYFIKHSTDLVNWSYYPVIVVGQDAVASMQFQTNSRPYFLRLGIEADPFSTYSDTDGMPDGWEVIHGLNPHDPSDAGEDLDGDGFTNLDEYGNGTDPQRPGPTVTLTTPVGAALGN